MRVFSVLLLLLTGTVFVTSPAALLARLTPDALSSTFWIVVILVYYILATLLPIDKIIGRLYPVFGAVLILMANEGFGLSAKVGYPAGAVFAAALFAVYAFMGRKVEQTITPNIQHTGGHASMKEHEHNRMPTIICAVTLVGFLVCVVVLIWRGMHQVSAWLFLLVCVYYGLVLYYGVKGYQKPHGDMLRYLIIILAVFTAGSVLMQIERYSAAWPIILSNDLAILAMGFLAGRLHKVERNKYVTVFVSLMLMIRCFWFLEHPGMSGADAVLFVLDRCQPIFMWLTLLLIYFYRYQEHKEAGLAVDVEESKESGPGGKA